MKPCRTALAALLLATLASSALAADDSDRIDCENAFSTLAINHCAAADNKRADDQLNLAYQQARKHLRELQQRGQCSQCDQALTLLAQAQREWIQFRDKDCQAIHNVDAEGTIPHIALQNCLAKRTRTRTQQLREDYSF